mgnify:CR=1 FL=1
MSLGAIIPSKAVVIHIPNLNEVAAMTWALALRNALAERLSVDYSELGWTAQQHGFVDGGFGYDIVVFDNAAGGSDYCLKAKDNLLELFMHFQHKRPSVCSCKVEQKFREACNLPQNWNQ